MNEDGVEITNPELLLLVNNKQDGINYRFRRSDSWTENYTLYRGEVKFNRLTQRQTIALPLMKTQLRTLIKDIDDMPVLYFQNLDNDKQAELFKNEYWKWTLEQNKADLKDIVDKRQVMFFGRSFDQWQVVDGKVKWSIVDPEDMLVSRYCDPTDIDSSRYLIHMHIFVPLSELDENPDYDPEAIKRLKLFYASAQGLIKSKTNKDSLIRKNQKLMDLGLFDADSPILGETYVELSMHFVYRKEEGDTDEEIYMYVEADQMEILMKKKHEDVVGVTKDHYWKNHFLYNSWADDVDLQDFWTDGVADILRPTNIVVNSWYSQLIENRTLRNFGMNYYDGTVAEGEFAPETFEPQAFGWYKLPGDPAKIVQKIDIPDLSESLDELQFLITESEKATGATTAQQGAASDKQVTLGEFKATLEESTDRVKGMSKFYTPAWKQRGQKFTKLVEAARDKLDSVKIWKKGRNSDNVYTREISPDDWQSEAGYSTQVWSQDEKDTQDMNSIQKLTMTSNFFPGNPKFQEIQQRKLLEYDDLTPDEINEVMEIEKQKREMMAQNPMGAMGGQPGVMPPQQGVPAQPQANGLGFTPPQGAPPAQA